MLGFTINDTANRMKDTIIDILKANPKTLAKEYLFIQEKNYDNENFLKIIDSLFIVALPEFKKKDFDSEVKSLLLNSELENQSLFSWIHALPNKDDLLLRDKLPDYGDVFSYEDAYNMLEEESISEYDGHGEWIFTDTRNSQLFKLNLNFDSFSVEETLKNIEEIKNKIPNYIEMKLLWFNQ